MNFVILDHLPPEPHQASTSRTAERHFDLMFETDINQKLLTFAIAELPSVLVNDVLFTKLDNHRREYLTYEGPLSENRGSVTRHSHGTWSGELSNQVVLMFDNHSKHFAGQSWKLRIRQSESLISRID